MICCHAIDLVRSNRVVEGGEEEAGQIWESSQIVKILVFHFHSLVLHQDHFIASWDSYLGMFLEILSLFFFSILLIILRVILFFFFESYSFIKHEDGPLSCLAEESRFHFSSMSPLWCHQSWLWRWRKGKEGFHGILLLAAWVNNHIWDTI